MLAPEPISNGNVSTGVLESIQAAASGPITNGVYDEAAASIIQHPLRGEIANIQQSIQETGLAISSVQKLRESLDGVKGALSQMREYLKEIASGNYSQEEKDKLWGEVRSVIQEYNDMVANIEHNSNKVFTTDGGSISISVGDGETMSIVAKDLRFDVEDLNLFGNSKSMAEKVKEAMEAIIGFDGFLLGVSQRIEKVTTHVQFELGAILDVVENIKEHNRNSELGIYSLSRVLEEAYKALRGQANIEPEAALQLLLDPIGSTAEDRVLEDILAESTE